jgi:hypothetical protein
VCAHPNVSAAAQVYAESDVVAIAHVASVEIETSRLTIELDRRYKGPDLSQLRIQPRVISDCNYDAIRRRGQHFVTLRANGDGTYAMPQLCESFPLAGHDGERDVPSATYRRQFLDAMQRQSLMAEAMARAHGGAANATLVAAYAVGSLAALAVLVAFAGRRGTRTKT